MNSCINLLCQPSVLLGALLPEFMLLDIQPGIVLIPDDGTNFDFYTYTIPGMKLVNIGDRVFVKVLGSMSDAATAFTVTAKLGGVQINPDAMVNLQAAGWWELIVVLTLVGTNTVKVEYAWAARAAGVSNNYLIFTNSVQVPTINNDLDLVFTANNSDTGTAIKVNLVTLDFVGNPGGTASHAGQPTNLVYHSIPDTITFYFDPAFPDPARWSLLDNNGGETGYFIAGNLRTFSGVTAYKAHGNNFYIVGVPSLASGSDEEVTQRSAAVNDPT